LREITLFSHITQPPSLLAGQNMRGQEFDEAYIISDLHIGGEGDKCLLGDPELLSQFIRKIKGRKSSRLKRCLVINGDFFDFLAEKSPKYFDISVAKQRLEEIIRRPAMSQIWDSLAEYLSIQSNYLAVVLGNHDLELASNAVQLELRDRLSNTDASAVQRVHFATQCLGFSCKLGRADLLCLHGNEFDPWNRVDQAELHRAVWNHEIRGKSEHWVPCSGTKLVVDVINQLKIEYPFVDAIKPIGTAVVPFLFGLAKLTNVPNLISTALKLLDAGESTIAGAGVFDACVSPDDKLLFERELLLQADLHLRSGSTSAIVNLSRLNSVERELVSDLKTLGTIRTELVRRSLKLCSQDSSFEIGTQDHQYLELEKIVSEKADIVVTGHTHLARFVERPSGGLYVNAGTWAHLYRTADGILSDEGAFEVFLNSLRGTSLPDLQGIDGLVKIPPHCCHVFEKKGKIFTELASVVRSNGKIEITPVKQQEVRNVSKSSPRTA
ncbi:MAG: metallophosphoesterase, partial [Planctomycetota bacterium]